MAFSDAEKLSTLKQKMKDAVEQGTTWSTFKAEFLEMPLDFKDEVVDFLGAELDRADVKMGEWATYKDNVEDLRDELVGG